jgi:excisionase family DNA binding protein
MELEVITKEDLTQFKHDLLNELKELLGSKPATELKWLKSYQVCELMGISRGTLHNMTTNGTLQATKLGRLMFYSTDDINRLMSNSKPRRSKF